MYNVIVKDEETHNILYIKEFSTDYDKACKYAGYINTLEELFAEVREIGV